MSPTILCRSFDLCKSQDILGLFQTDFFDGFIDELRVYEGALDIVAVRNDFNHLWCSAVPPPPPPGAEMVAL